MSETRKAQKQKARFLETYEEYGDAIFAFIHSRTSNRDVALDITQDVFTKVWSYMAKGRRIQNLRAFCFRVARNAVTDYYRKKRAVSLEELVSQGFEHSDRGLAMAMAHVRHDADYSMRALSALSAKHYQVIQMRYVQDMSLDEMAFELGVEKNTISVQLHRALHRASSHLRSLYSHDGTNQQAK